MLPADLADEEDRGRAVAAALDAYATTKAALEAHTVNLAARDGIEGEILSQQAAVKLGLGTRRQERLRARQLRLAAPGHDPVDRVGDPGRREREQEAQQAQV